MPIYVLRHGQTEWNLEGRLQGHGDSPLTALGREQARLMGVALHRCLESRDIDLVASPLGRAVQTAEIAGRQLEGVRIAWRTDDRLREIGVGTWEGRTRQELVRAGTHISADRSDDDWFLDAPGAETLPDFTSRVASFLNTQTHERTVVIVCHGQTGMILRGLYLGLSAADSLTLDQPQDAFYRLADGKAFRIAAVDSARVQEGT